MASIDKIYVDQDIRGFSDARLTACITLSELLLKSPAQPDDDPSQRETLTRRLGMFRAEQAERDDTATTIDRWERIVAEAQADGANPFA